MEELTRWPSRGVEGTSKAPDERAVSTACTSYPIQAANREGGLNADQPAFPHALDDVFAKIASISAQIAPGQRKSVAIWPDPREKPGKSSTLRRLPRTALIVLVTEAFVHDTGYRPGDGEAGRPTARGRVHEKEGLGWGQARIKRSRGYRG